MLMFHFLKCRENEAVPQKEKHSPSHAKPFSGLAVPGFFLLYKFNEYKRQQKEKREEIITEKELKKLNNKIVSENLIYCYS